MADERPEQAPAEQPKTGPTVEFQQDEPTTRDEEDATSINEAARGDDLPPGYFLSWQFIGMVTGLAFGVISAYVIFVMSTSVLAYTNLDIGPSANIAWVSIARNLAQSFGFLIQGRLGDLFGRRWLFIIGNLVALLGIIICAVAQDVDTLIVASAIYGLGECVQISFGAAVGELVPNRTRPMILSGVFFTSAPFAAFGPMIARHWVDIGMGWRWNFYLGIIIVGVAAALLYFCYHPPTFEMLHERKSKKQLLKEWDYVGMFLWTAGLTLFLMGLSWGGGLFPWASPAVICAIVIGAALLVGFGFWEAYADLKYPIMPMHLFLNRGYISLVAIAAIASMYYYSAVLIWPQQVSNMLTDDITEAGWLSCTVPASVVLGQGVCGFMIRWGGNTRNLMIGSSVVMVAFISSMAALTPDRRDLGIAFTMLGPFWVGFIETACLAVAPLFCKPEDIGLASGMLASIRSAGGSIAVAVYTTVLTNRLSTTLTDIAGPVAVDAGYPDDAIPALVSGIRAGNWIQMPEITEEIAAAVRRVMPQAYSEAYSTVYLASIAFGSLSIISACFTLDAKQYLTDKVERRMHGGKLGGEIKKDADEEKKTVMEDEEVQR